MKRYLYAYFGDIVPTETDIPGHFLYQPFLIDEICSRLAGEEDYKIDLYSYLVDYENPKSLTRPVEFNYFLPSVNHIMNAWKDDHLGVEDGKAYVSLIEVFRNLYRERYDALILKARFRNPSTHAKKMYDVKKFEAIVQEGINFGTPILIVDTDLALPPKFIEVINARKNIKIIALGNVKKAYPNLKPEKILSPVPLYGISVMRLKEIYEAFEKEPQNIIHAQRKRTLLYYGNIASSNYKSGHTKNYEVLEYLIKLSEERFFHEMNGYIIGKVEDKRFVNGFEHVMRYCRSMIADLHREARLSVNISKELYEKTDFSPARITESWVFGILPLSYSSDGNYQNNRTLVFKNYMEFVECVRLYLVDTSLDDYYKMFMQCMKNCINFREKEGVK